MFVRSSIGSPTTSARMRSTNRVVNSSAIGSATMKRLAAMHDWPLLIVRAFTAVVHGGVEIGARHHDERVAAAQLEHRLLDVLSGRRGDAASRAFAAGERRRGDAIVGDDARDRVGSDEQSLKHAARRARLVEELLDRQRALRHVRRVLEQADVAGRQRRRREADHLPEREIPRHHGEHDAERLERDVAALVRRLRPARRRESGGVVGVEAAARRALRRFLDRRA